MHPVVDDLVGGQVLRRPDECDDAHVPSVARRGIRSRPVRLFAPVTKAVLPILPAQGRGHITLVEPGS